MLVAFFNPDNRFLFVASMASGMEQEMAVQATAQAHGLSEYYWLEVTNEEAVELQKPPEPTPEQIIQDFTVRVQLRLDDFARSDGKFYDNMLSLCTYATSTNPVFAREGQYGVEARDATWAAAYGIMNAVLAGERPIPAWEELEAELPALAWPEGSRGHAG